MTGQQHAVMWMGLLLIVLRMFTTVQWSELKSVLATPGGNAPATQQPSSSPGGGILHVVAPGLGLLGTVAKAVIPGAGPLIPGATPTGASHG